MNFELTKFSGLILVNFFESKDNRGNFIKPWITDQFTNVFGNIAEVYSTYSDGNVLRGLHYQIGENAQKKYVVCLSGLVEDLALDLRLDSKTFGEIFRIKLEGMSGMGVIIPEGFAHGIFAHKPSVVLTFCDKPYSPTDERGINWNSLKSLNDLNVKHVSDKDLNIPHFSEYYRL